MCNKRNSTRIKIKGKVIRVDKCMKNVIEYLNNRGILTLACCCGHGKYPPSIVVFELRIKALVDAVELFSWKHIPRKVKFYKKDKDGYFFIPETLSQETGP